MSQAAKSTSGPKKAGRRAHASASLGWHENSRAGMREFYLSESAPLEPATPVWRSAMKSCFRTVEALRSWICLVINCVLPLDCVPQRGVKTPDALQLAAASVPGV
jgi:hypothetical protein